MVGLGIIAFLVILALFALTQPFPWTDLNNYCAYTPNAPGSYCAPGEASVCVYTTGTARRPPTVT